MKPKCSECYYFLDMINECDKYKCKMFPGNDVCNNFVLRHGIPKDIHKTAEIPFDFKSKNDELKNQIHKLSTENEGLRFENAKLLASNKQLKEQFVENNSKKVKTSTGTNKISVAVKYN